MRGFFFLVAVRLVFCGSVHANSGEIQKARFEIWLKEIRMPLNAPTASDAADRMIQSSARNAASHLQALGKLYERHKRFEKLREEFKKMEDSIGEYEKWENILEKAKKKDASQDSLDRLRDKKKEAKKKLAQFLDKEGWIATSGPSKLDAIESLIDDFEWESYDQDRRKVLKELSQQLSRVDQAEFDLSRLEKGNGLHELRRELRWFLMEARALNGLIQLRSDANCSYEEAANWRYADIPVSDTEVQPCYISRCLFLGVVDSVHRLGKIKDKAEAANNISRNSDIVPNKLEKEAHTLYKEIKSTRVMSKLQDQLATCQ